MRLPPIPPTSQQSNDLLGFTLDEHNPIAPTYHVLTILQEDICPFFTIRSMTGVLIVWLLLGCCYEVQWKNVGDIVCGRRVLERVVNVGLYCLFGCVFISRLERVLGSYDIVLRGVVVQVIGWMIVEIVSDQSGDRVNHASVLSLYVYSTFDLRGRQNKDILPFEPVQSHTIIENTDLLGLNEINYNAYRQSDFFKHNCPKKTFVKYLEPDIGDNEQDGHPSMAIKIYKFVIFSFIVCSTEQTEEIVAYFVAGVFLVLLNWLSRQFGKMFENATIIILITTLSTFSLWYKLKKG